MKTLIFDNHPPLNITIAEVAALSTRGGGRYKGVGENTYTVLRGGRLHLTHFHTTGCDGDQDTSEYLHQSETAAEMIQFLLTQPVSWWTNDLLMQLGWSGEAA